MQVKPVLFKGQLYGENSSLHIKKNTLFDIQNFAFDI